MSKPTDGALRAARTAMQDTLNPIAWTACTRDQLAEIIDRETMLPVLIEALNSISKARVCGDHTRDMQTLEACITIACRALAGERGEDCYGLTSHFR